MPRARSFSSRMMRRSEESRVGMARVVADKMLVVGEELALATPVKKGVMRSNWRAGRGLPRKVIPAYSPNPGSERAESTGPNFSGAVAQHQLVAALYTNPLQPLFLANNTPYLSKVNYGTAKQTPVGFIERGIDRAGKRSARVRIFGSDFGVRTRF